MEKRYFALLFLVLTSGVIAYQIIDPKPEEQPTEVDLSAPPSEIAFDALKQTQTWNYTYTETWTVTVENETETVRVKQTKVDHSDDQYYTEYVTDRFAIDAKAIFGNDVRDWIKYDSWTRDSTLHPYHDGYSPFKQLDYVQNASVKVVNQSDSVLVLRIENEDTANRISRGFRFQESQNSSVTLHIDRRTGHLRKAVLKNVLTSIVEEKTVTYRFSDFGTTEVTRPEGIEYTVDEFFRDLLDKPKNVK